MSWLARRRCAAAGTTMADRGIRWCIAILILTTTITTGRMSRAAGGWSRRRREVMRGRAARRRRGWNTAGSDRLARDMERGNNAQDRGNTQAGLAKSGRGGGAHVPYRRAAVLERSGVL